jgi:hypothetical protein
MSELIFFVVVGAVVAFIVPPFVPSQFRGRFTDTALRVVGMLIVLVGIASTSFVYVPDGHLGLLFRVYAGSSLPQGRIVAVNGENGPQADLLTPGFHPRLLVNVIYNVDTSNTEENVLAGKVAVLVAKDGAPLRPGQVFADPFPVQLGYGMLDAETFLKNGGQRGPQLTVLPPGKYRLNKYLWDVAQKDSKEIAAGFVGVVKSNVNADIDFGTLQAKKPDNCDTIRHVVNATQAGGGNTQQLDAPVVPAGCIGVWNKALIPGKYYFNPDAFAITDIDTRAQVWTYSGGYKRANISLTVDAKGDIVQTRTEIDVPVDKDNADRAVFVKMEGWDVPLELRVVAQVSPDQAACIVAGIGGLKEVQERVLTPSIRAITRDVSGGSYAVTEPKADENGKLILNEKGEPVIVTVNRPTRVLDLINQRPLIETEIERRIQPEAEKSCVTIREVRLGEPAIPPELLVAVRREQLATQLAKAFIQEKLAQDQRVTSENAKATADQQGKLVESVIGVQRSIQTAEAARNEGAGERDKLEAIAEGQQKQMAILGVDATVRLRQYELLVNRVFDFVNAHPEVLTAALGNAQKFVPNISVGGTSDNGLGGMLMALFGQSLSNAASIPAVSPTLINRTPPGATATEPARQ